MTRARLSTALVLLAGAFCSNGDAHEAHTTLGAGHASPGSEPKPQVLAPGWEPLAFEAPAPGSYELPPLGRAGDGEVLTMEGEPIRLHALLRGRLALLSFIYTSCNDVNGCPLAVAVLRGTKQRLEADPRIAGEMRLISLSFDPRHDTPSVIKRYAEPLLGGPMEWDFLTTASKERLAPILNAYGQGVIEDYDEEGRYLGTMSHILRVFLIDRQKRIRNIYGVSTLHADTLVNDVKTLLLEEEGGGESGARVMVSSRGSRLQGPGDFKEGYERQTYRTRSRTLLGRTGTPVNLLEVLEEPPLGLPPVPVPAANPPTERKVALGRRLFFDRRLSFNDTISCAMCHVPEQGFTSNELATAVGIEGRTVRRNSPTLYNAAYFEHLFHDGREHSLEQQVWGPLLASNEMGNPSIGVVIGKIESMPDYDGLFAAAFEGRGPGMETIGMAIASYERTLVSGSSAFDRWYFANEADALDEPAKRGFELFRGEAGCGACHRIGEDHALFTDDGFHNTGLGFVHSMRPRSGTRNIRVAPGMVLEVADDVVADASERPPSDLGRYEITQDPADRWRYKTPSLRNVALTAPYMHDGALGTLRDVVEFYNRGGVPNESLDPLIRPLALGEDEIEDLVAFLESLTGSNVDELVSDAFAAPIGDVRKTSRKWSR